MTTLLEQAIAGVQSITPEHHAAIVAFCRRNHIHRLALFGSVLRQDFRPESDVDVLVEFAPDHTPGLGLIRMQDELSRLFHDRRVDLVTLKFLNSRIRERVLTEAQAIYVEG
jgi:predicted nucleotidyltransferase